MHPCIDRRLCGMAPSDAGRLLDAHRVIPVGQRHLDAIAGAEFQRHLDQLVVTVLANPRGARNGSARGDRCWRRGWAGWSTSWLPGMTANGPSTVSPSQSSLQNSKAFSNSSVDAVSVKSPVTQTIWGASSSTFARSARIDFASAEPSGMKSPPGATSPPNRCFFPKWTADR